MTFLLETLRLGLTNLLLHKLRSLLTVLGIIIGVAAVIAMVSIGDGSKRRALADIQQLGATNIIVRSIKPPDPPTTGENSRNLSYGIRRRDARRIEGTVDSIRRVVPLKQVAFSASQGIWRSSAAVFGTIPPLREVTSLEVERGRYLHDDDIAGVANVAVIGAEVAARLFPLDDPLGGMVRVESQVFRVVGVLRRVGLAGGAGASLVGRDLNFDIHIPMSTARARFGDMNVDLRAGSTEATTVELSELIIEVTEQSRVEDVADQVQMILDAEHKRAGDVTKVVPLELLAQAERTQLMFNVLMISIASLSLMVGGIGIMNIMLASVTERTREIGIRRALGATRRHIVMQFLVETAVLSGLGGLMGVTAGLLLVAIVAVVSRYYASIAPPHVTMWSIVVSFTVASVVGLIFGLYPAVRASQQDPIVALRHD